MFVFDGFPYLLTLYAPTLLESSRAPGEGGAELFDLELWPLENKGSCLGCKGQNLEAQSSTLKTVALSIF